MQEEATSKDLLWLETIFTYERNKDSISVIRKQVEIYENLIIKRAEELELAKLNTSDVKMLQKE